MPSPLWQVVSFTVEAATTREVEEVVEGIHRQVEAVVEGIRRVAVAAQDMHPVAA